MSLHAQQGTTPPASGEKKIPKGQTISRDTDKGNAGEKTNRTNNTPSPALTVKDQPILPDENTEIQRKLVNATIALVVVGALQFLALIVQAVVFWRTLKKIKTQADQMERQTGILEKSVSATEANAIAAKDSATALINSERAWILPNRIVPKNLSEMVAQAKPEETAFQVVVELTNYGQTPAWLIDSVCEFIIVNPQQLEKVIDYGRITRPFPDGISIQPRQPQPFTVIANPAKLITEVDLNKMRRGELVACVYGFVTYRDVFGEIRKTNFRSDYVMSVSPTIREGWYFTGPEGANRCT